MTAASAFPTEPSESRPSEPSMEDILASIRRIIADDQNQGGRPVVSGNGARRLGAEAAEGDRAVARTRTPYDDVLDLARLVPSAERAASRPAELPHASVAEAVTARHDETDEGHGHEDPPDHQSYGAVAGLRARLPEPLLHDADRADDEAVSDHPVPAVSDETEGDLLSGPLGASVMSAFETLAATVVLQNTPMLERVMRDLLRPMLKTWLDDNLPGLVERLVRAEIERVARGSRG